MKGQYAPISLAYRMIEAKVFGKEPAADRETQNGVSIYSIIRL